MKKIIILLVTILTLQGCQVILPTKVETLNLVFSPNISEETFFEHKNEFLTQLKTELLNNGYDVSQINVQLASTNDQATEMLLTKVSDFGFLTKLSYFEHRENNLEVLLTELKSTYNLSTDNLDNWNDKAQLDASKDLLDHHYAGIYTGASPKGQELYTKIKQGEKLSWIDLNTAKWCHIVVTSQEGYIYPSLWLIDNYSRRISELFSHERVVKGYPEMMEKLANQTCDIVVGPDTIRDEYAKVWTQSKENGGFNQSTSIYNDVKLIALSSPILHDPVVYSTLNEKMGEGLVKAIQKSLINMTQSETKNPLLEAMDVKGLVESNNEAYDSFKPAYDYLHSIFN